MLVPGSVASLAFSAPGAPEPPVRSRACELGRYRASLIAAFWGATGFYMVDAAGARGVVRFGRCGNHRAGSALALAVPDRARRKGEMSPRTTSSDATRSACSPRTKICSEHAPLLPGAVSLRPDPLKFLFNVRDPESTLLRDGGRERDSRAIGQSALDFVLGAGRREMHRAHTGSRFRGAGRLQDWHPDHAVST